MAFGIPSWTCEGVVTDARELKTKEGKVFAYVAKIACAGMTIEVQTKEEAVYKQLGQGAEVQAVGTFEQYNNALRCIVSKVKPVGKAA